MTYLTDVQFILPSYDTTFQDNLTLALQGVTHAHTGILNFAQSNPNYLPHVTLSYEDTRHPYVVFTMESGDTTRISITNESNITKESPEVYTHISFAEFFERVEDEAISAVDHLGFNLPCFDGIDPRILEIRKTLHNSCIYLTLAETEKDAAWDFIVPGTRNEIDSGTLEDTSGPRMPKIEIVSFDKSSTPLVQCDVVTSIEFEKIAQLFPEGIHDHNLRNVWVYIENTLGIDFCFVLNHESPDWVYTHMDERSG